MNENEKERMLDAMLSLNIIVGDFRRLISIYSPETLFNLLTMVKGSLLFDIICSEIIKAGKITALKDYMDKMLG